jgi:hypothetical protein
LSSKKKKAPKSGAFIYNSYKEYFSYLKKQHLTESRIKKIDKAMRTERKISAPGNRSRLGILETM